MKAWRGVRGVGVRRISASLALLLGFALVSACKTSEDAAAAASQLAKTAKDLSSYYAAIQTALKNTRDLSELQNVMYGTPLDEQYLAQLKDAGSEIEKRAQMAKSLEQLADAFTKLTGAKAASDDATAANKLGQELVSIKALPKGLPVPDALGAAAQQATVLMQERKEKEAAPALAKILSAVSDLFTKEKPAYESIYKDYVSLAQSIATNMVDKNQVDTGMFLSPALAPFHMTEQVHDAATADALNRYAKTQIASESAELNAAQQKASDAMETALSEMAKRLDQLATEKTMSARAAPITLDEVEQWLSKVASSVESSAGNAE